MEGVAEINSAISFLDRIDKDLTLAVNGLHSPFTDAIWQLFSGVKIWYIMYLVIIVFFFVRLGWKRGLIVTLSCILLVVACDQIANLVKLSVLRLRPLEDPDMVARGLHILEKSDGHLYGFFSAHAANAMGFAVCSSMGFKNDSKRRYKGYTTLIIIWAVLVAVSRIFVGKHFAGDVLAGIIAGLLVGLLFGWLGQKACRLAVKD